MSQNPTKRTCPSSETENVVCVGQSGETYTENDKFSFLWTVRNYSELSDMKSFTSPIFHGGSKTNHSWQLLAYPKEKVGNVEYLGLYLQLVECGDAYDSADKVVKTAYYQFSILNADGQPATVEFRKLNTSFRKSGQFQGSNQLISSAELVAPSRRLVVNDSFKILCQGGLQVPQHKLSDGNLERSDKKRRRLWKDGLVNGVEQLYKQSIGTDVTISVGPSSFKAHKAVLTARSSVFAAMFNNVNMFEMKTASVIITDFDAEVVKGMLDHLYTGHADCMADRALELLQIADKYDLDDLKTDCEYVIAKSIGNDNCVEILTLADKHNASFLKSRAVGFIKRNKRELSQLKSFQATVRENSAGGLFAELFLLL